MNGVAASLWLSLASSLPAAAGPCRDEPREIPLIELAPAAEGLRQPVHIASPRDGSGRLFIVEQAGVIRMLKDGRLLPKPFLDIRGRVKSGGEMGLLSVAFHPAFTSNGRLFVNYTSAAGGLHSVISEFTAAKDADRADPAAERVLLTLPQPYRNHNGGQNAFGPDGFLYVGFGDGGSGDDPHDNGQRLDTLLGKMLRIDVDRRDPEAGYAIPPGNPLAGRDGARPEIWAWGLRNPWRFSFDALTGALWAADVGQDDREEIDLIRKGGNYGWRVMEGSICTPGVNKRCTKEGFEPPVHEYGRREGVSVTGGFVYRGRNVPGLCGAYVYGDFGSGRIWGLRYDHGKRLVLERRLINDSDLPISSFGEGEDFELYVADHGGRVLRLDAAR